MNFLAHALLSGDDDAVLVGNVCADFIKGVALADLPDGVVDGVRLHRAIDRLTDRHPDFVRCRTFIAPRRRRYAPVILDVFFDHCLARDWGAYADIDLGPFVERVCGAIDARFSSLPVRDPDRLRRMVDSRWLTMYRSREGIDAVFAGLHRRARFTDALADAARDLDAHYEHIAARFRTVFPDVRRTVARIRSGVRPDPEPHASAIVRGSTTA